MGLTVSAKNARLGVLVAAASAVVFATAAMPAPASQGDPYPIVPVLPCYPDCQGADLHGRTANNTQMPNGNFNEANLRNSYLAFANLSGSTFVDTNLHNAGLYGVNLTDADLSGADASKANLKTANLTDADLSGANLTKANLKDANLTNADLSGTNFYKANLKNANLTGADITGVDFRRAKFKHTICPDGKKTNKGC